MSFLAYHENITRGTFDFPIELTLVTESHPRYHMPFHWHMEYELIMVTRGELALSLDTKLFHLKEGDVAIVADGVVHGGAPNTCRYECIVFDMGGFLLNNHSANNAVDLFPEYARQIPHHSKETEEAGVAASLFSVMEKAQNGYELITTGLLWQLIGTLIKNSEGNQPRQGMTSRSSKKMLQIKKALRNIQTDFAEPMTLDDLAKRAGLSPKYFCRAFAEITGKTPIDYLNYYRIECAGERLLTTDETVTDIALSCGFNDLSYFTRTFRKYKEASPREYRGKLQERAE